MHQFQASLCSSDGSALLTERVCFLHGFSLKRALLRSLRRQTLRPGGLHREYPTAGRQARTRQPTNRSRNQGGHQQAAVRQGSRHLRSPMRGARSKQDTVVERLTTLLSSCWDRGRYHRTSEMQSLSPSTRTKRTNPTAPTKETLPSTP